MVIGKRPTRTQRGSLQSEWGHGQRWPCGSKESLRFVPRATLTVTWDYRCDVEYYENIDWHLETATALPPAVQQVPILSVNRYKDILPNPRTRVPLKRVGNDPISEYINANFVRGPDGNPHHYICTMVRAACITHSQTLALAPPPSPFGPC